MLVAQIIIQMHGLSVLSFFVVVEIDDPFPYIIPTTRYSLTTKI